MPQRSWTNGTYMRQSPVKVRVEACQVMEADGLPQEMFVHDWRKMDIALYVVVDREPEHHSSQAKPFLPAKVEVLSLEDKARQRLGRMCMAVAPRKNLCRGIRRHREGTGSCLELANFHNGPCCLLGRRRLVVAISYGPVHPKPVHPQPLACSKEPSTRE